MGNVCCEDQQYAGHGGHAHPIRKVSTNKTDKLELNTNIYQPSKAASENNSPQLNTALVNMARSCSQGDIVRHGPENYQSIKYLGKGTFGDVVLAEDKESGNQYAMKIIEKKNIKQVNLMQNQVIKKISQNDLFVKIRQTFQNQSKIYIVMEYLSKGDIYYYLKKRACVFNENTIKMIVAQILVGIEILHKEGVIYRQLKPQNILVTNEGHVKLGDYGLSRLIVQQKNPLSTFVGTLQYTAPQVLDGHYDKKADIWAIGILMYELKFEQNLFEGENNETNDDVKSNIQQTNIEQVLNGIVGKVSYDFRDLLIKLLQREPSQRISLQQVKKHPFFQGVNWEDIPLRKNPPPLKQILESDHIKFKDPNNYVQNAHRKKLQTKDKQIELSLFEFRQPEPEPS